MTATSMYAPVATQQQYQSPAYATQQYQAQQYQQQAQQYQQQPYGAPTYAAPQTMSGPAMGAPGMAAPALNSPTPATGSVTVPNTFQPSSTPASQGSSSLMPTTPIPDNNSGAPRLLDPQSRTTSAEIIGPATVNHAIFNTADRGSVFHPITYRTPSKSSAQSTNDGWSADSDNWQSGEGR
jgi:hypothetical protein